MAATIKYRSVYEMAVHANDVKSGRPITNLFYHRCGVQSAAPPAFGAAIAGPSDLQVWTQAFAAVFLNGFASFMSDHYVITDYTCRQITGWSVGGTPRTVINAENTNPAIIHTVGNHNLSTGDSVTITGALGNTAVNGAWLITVLTATTFSVPVAGNGLYTGGGSWQLTVVLPHLTYGDTHVEPGVPGTDVGAIAGDALPLMASQSIFRKSVRSGRNWKGRLSISPITETNTLNGKITDAELATRQAAVSAYRTSASKLNGGTDATSKFMIDVIFSKSVALLQTPPFTESETYAADMASMIVRQNQGSIVRRKPRLTSVIAS